MKRSMKLFFEKLYKIDKLYLYNIDKKGKMHWKM